jgi:hypothetical protein
MARNKTFPDFDAAVADIPDGAVIAIGGFAGPGKRDGLAGQRPAGLVNHQRHRHCRYASGRTLNHAAAHQEG